MRVWLVCTAMLGIGFIGGQMYEFTTFVEEGLTISTSVFGSSFFVLTGFHGAHVTVGIFMLLALIGMSMADRLGTSEKAHARSSSSGLYWHFVDIVWIVIFTVIYLIPTELRKRA